MISSYLSVMKSCKKSDGVVVLVSGRRDVVLLLRSRWCLNRRGRQVGMGLDEMG